MTETYSAGCSWLGRRESAEACAQRAEHFFQLLGRCDPAWRRWNELADAGEAPRPSSVPDALSFMQMFGKKKNQQGKEGFRFGLWVGNTLAEATAVNARCGAGTPWLSSTCMLQFPTEGLISERVLRTPVMAGVMRSMVEAWEPEWGVVTSEQHRNEVSANAHEGTFVGGIMYFSRQRGRVPLLPSPVLVEPVGDWGTLVTLTPERFTASRQEHVALAARVQERLQSAGLLGPLRPWQAA